MKSRLLLIIIISLFVSHVVAQMQVDVNPNSTNTITMMLSKTINKNNSYSDYEGSPFLYDDYREATLVLNNSTIIANVKIKINLFTNEIFYLQNNTESIAIDGLIKHIQLPKSIGDTQKVVYKSGFNFPNGIDNNFFLEVILDGKLKILNKRTKFIAEQKNPLTGVVTRYFDESNKWFVSENNTLKEVEFNKKFFDVLLQDKAIEIKTFVSNEKINFKKELHIKK